MRIHNVTPWDAGNILTSCADYLGAKEEDLRGEAGYTEEADILRESRFKIGKCFNKLDQWDFALPDSEPTPGASGREGE